MLVYKIIPPNRGLVEKKSECDDQFLSLQQQDSLCRSVASKESSAHYSPGIEKRDHVKQNSPTDLSQWDASSRPDEELIKFEKKGVSSEVKLSGRQPWANRRATCWPIKMRGRVPHVSCSQHLHETRVNLSFMVIQVIYLTNSAHNSSPYTPNLQFLLLLSYSRTCVP